MSEHFTAHVVVKRVENTSEKRDRHNVIDPAKRDVSDVAEYTVRGETLEELTRKMTAMQIASIYDAEYERAVQVKKEREKAKAETSATYGKILDSRYPA